MAASSLVQGESPSAIPQSPDPTQVLLQFTTSYVPCSALWVAAELKLADLIGMGSKSVADLARGTATNDDALFRILRLLAMVGIFTETEPRHFALTPPAELLRSDHPQSMRDTVVWLADPFHFNIAAELSPLCAYRAAYGRARYRQAGLRVFLDQPVGVRSVSSRHDESERDGRQRRGRSLRFLEIQNHHRRRRRSRIRDLLHSEEVSADARYPL